MADARMLTVFCYDIDRARKAVAAVLEDVAVRVQRSVFEARLTRQATERLVRLAERHLGPGDSLRVYAVPADALPRCVTCGSGPSFLEGGYLLF